MISKIFGDVDWIVCFVSEHCANKNTNPSPKNIFSELLKKEGFRNRQNSSRIIIGIYFGWFNIK